MIRILLIFSLLIVSMIFAKEAVVTDEVLLIKSDDVGEIYFDDKLYADSLFKNKTFVIEGTVVRVKESYVHGCLVELAVGQYRINKVDCFFTMDDFNDLYRLHKGLRVRIKGTCTGRSGRGVDFQSCSVDHFDVPDLTAEQKFQKQQHESYDQILQENLRYFVFDP